MRPNGSGKSIDTASHETNDYAVVEVVLTSQNRTGFPAYVCIVEAVRLGPRSRQRLRRCRPRIKGIVMAPHEANDFVVVEVVLTKTSRNNFLTSAREQTISAMMAST